MEAVLIPMLHRKGTRRHITLCVSSQVCTQVAALHHSGVGTTQQAWGLLAVAVTQALFGMQVLMLVFASTGGCMHADSMTAAAVPHPLAVYCCCCWCCRLGVP